MLKLCVSMEKQVKCLVYKMHSMSIVIYYQTLNLFSIVFRLLFFNYRRKRTKCATTEESRGSPKEPNNIQAEQNESFQNGSALPRKRSSKKDKSAKCETDNSSDSEMVENTNTKSQSKLQSKRYFTAILLTRLSMKCQISYSYGFF